MPDNDPPRDSRPPVEFLPSADMKPADPPASPVEPPVSPPPPSNVTPIEEGARIRAARQPPPPGLWEKLRMLVGTFLLNPTVDGALTDIMQIAPSALEEYSKRLLAIGQQKAAADLLDAEAQAKAEDRAFLMAVIDRVERLAITATALAASGKQQGASTLDMAAETLLRSLPEPPGDAPKPK